MEPAVDHLRAVLLAPSLKGIAAVSAVLWASLVESAPESFYISLLAVSGLYVIDTALGIAHWYGRGEFSRKRFPRFIGKAITYSCFAWVAFFAGAAADSLVGLSGGQAAFVSITVANVVLAATEGLSCLDHIDALTGGTLSLAPVRNLLEQLRAGRLRQSEGGQ